MKLKHESPTLEDEFQKIRTRKQTLIRNTYGIKLLSAGRSTRVRKVFGSALEPYFLSLSNYDYRKGELSVEQKKDVQAISSLMNRWIKEHTHIGLDLVVSKELENALVAGDSSSFAISVAARLAEWKKTQPNYRLRLGECWNWSPGELESALTDKELAEAAEAEGTTIGGVVGTVIGIFEAIDKAIGIINEIIDWGCGPDLEEHENNKIWRQSYLDVPWRGFDWGDNNQEFTAQYIVQINEGVVDELKVNFRIDLSGSGFDRLEYPIEAQAFTTDGTVDPTPSAIRTTRYQQIHEFVAHNVNFMVIGVIGKAFYGLDGFMTDAGLVPTGTATIGDSQLNFGGGGDSIWKYGISV